MQKICTFDTPPAFLGWASVGGYEERRGPLGEALDFGSEDDHFGQKSWERAEGEMGRICLSFALKRAGMTPDDLDLLIAGDLQNQCVASSGGLYTFGIPFLGVYGACSTATESLLLLSSLLSGQGNYRAGAAVTSSHNCAAEKQFRLPLEYGGQRPPTAQWTATAAGAFLLGHGEGVKIREVMAGKIVDSGITDATNMGAAMAPAALDSILSYFRLSGKRPDEFDAVVTGDLGEVGSSILREMLDEQLPGVSARHLDCGLLLYDRDKQDVHAGGSGCGCSAAVLAAHFLPAIAAGRMKHILFLSTGALMNPSSVQQGVNIAGIAPLLHLSSE